MAYPFDLEKIGAGLPVAQSIPQIVRELRQSRRCIVEAPPGTGKTTLVPPAVANLVAEDAARGQKTGAPGRVIVTGPRRLAVRAAADRLRQLSAGSVGGTNTADTSAAITSDAARARKRHGLVGHRMHGDSVAGTAVEFVTPAVLVRMLLSDPALDGVSAIILDEVHERQLDTDLALAFAAELAELREDLYLLVMSATLPAEGFSRVLPGAPVVSTPAVTHPTEVSYHPHPGRMSTEPRRRAAFWAHLAQLADAAVARTGHSALVFAPGAREVDEVAYLCQTRAFRLHGRLSAAEQRAAMSEGSGPRVVVATSIAESALTVPGVRVVVDSGMSRVPRRDAERGMQGLVTVSETQATAEQRAGRAGREGPGLVLRAFSAQDYRHFDADITPEITTTELTQAALWMAEWGTPLGVGLKLLTPPPRAGLDTAGEVLLRLGAVEADGSITELGRRLARLPLDPRLGRALLALGEPAAEALAALAAGLPGDLARASAPRSEVRRLERLSWDASAACGAVHARSSGAGSARRNSAERTAGLAVALAYPERVARREGNTDQYLLAGGSRAQLPADLGLSGARWLAIGEVTRVGSPSSAGRAGATIRSAARIDEADALGSIGVTERYSVDWAASKLQARKVLSTGAIELSSTPTRVTAQQAAPAIAQAIAREGLELFAPSAKARALIERLRFLHAQVGAPWPDPAAVDPFGWLGPELDQLARGKSPGSIDLYPALQRLLPWPEATRLDELAPARLQVPSGSHPRVDYSTGVPVVRVKLQECFGLAQSPTCAGVPVQFRLLSPAGRDLAITSDLASFWAGPYHQVRSEMRGRYPKHPWPDDP